MEVAFVRIPKTASRAIKATGLFLCEGHEPIGLVKEKYNFDKSFAVCRNPYARVVSAYHQGIDYFIRQKTPFFTEYADYKTFTSFVIDENNPFLYGTVRGREQKKNVKHPHYNSQSHYIAEDGKVAVDELLYYELFPEQFDMFLFKVDKPHVDLEMVNVSHHAPWRHYYNVELAEIIYKHYEEDFRLLDYHKESWRYDYGKSI